MTLTCDHLSYSYGATGRPVLRDVSLTFDAPVTAIIGPNGAGKSTLLRLLGGVADQRGQSGSVELDNTPIARVPVGERVRRMAYMSQSPRVSAPLSVSEVVALGRATQDPDDEAVGRALATVGLSDRGDERFEHLSIGQRQLAAFARVLAQLDGPDAGETRYLLADEPVASLDPRHAIVISQQVRAAADRGIRGVLIVHDVGFAAAIADRVVCLGEDGAVRAEGHPDEVLTREVLEDLFGCRFGETNGARLYPVYRAPASDPA